MARRVRDDEEPEDDYDDDGPEDEDQDDDDDDQDDGDEVVILRGRRADRFLEQYGQDSRGSTAAGPKRKPASANGRGAGRPVKAAARRSSSGESERDRRPRAKGYFGDR